MVAAQSYGTAPAPGKTRVKNITKLKKNQFWKFNNKNDIIPGKVHFLFQRNKGPFRKHIHIQRGLSSADKRGFRCGRLNFLL